MKTINWKEFLKPTIGKIILFIILFFISFVFSYFAQGFPLKFMEFYIPTGLQFKSLFNLISDIVFWYLVVCLIVFIYHKIRKKY